LSGADRFGEARSATSKSQHEIARDPSAAR
jgi:hypothetical protein